MSAAAGQGQGGLGRRSKREVVDVAEPKVPDKRLDQLLHVRKQRLGRLERERNEARQLWRARRPPSCVRRPPWPCGTGHW